MIGDDLTGLLGRPPGPDSGFRQGTVLTFDPESGANTIAVAGGILTDVPVLNIGDLVQIVPGDVVVLLRLRSSWAILGRIMAPGSSSMLVGTSDFSTDNAFASNFSITTSFVTRVSVSFPVPSWANFVQVFAGMTATCHNTGTAQAYTAQILIDGATSGALGTWSDVGVQRALTATYARGNTGPGPTVLVEGQLKSAASTIPAHTGTAAILSATAIIRRIKL